jgi:hypothetical protein
MLGLLPGDVEFVRRGRACSFAHDMRQTTRALSLWTSDNGQSVNFVGLDVAGLMTTPTRASAVLAHEGLRSRGVGQKTTSSTLVRVRLGDTFGRSGSATWYAHPCYPANSSSNALASWRSAVSKPSVNQP